MKLFSERLERRDGRRSRRRSGVGLGHGKIGGVSAVPDVLAPNSERRLLRDQPRPRLCGRGGALREPAQRLLAAAPRRRASRRACSTRRSSSSCRAFGIGLTNAALRTTKGSGDLRSADFAGSAERLERLARELRPARDRLRRQGGVPRRVPRAARSSAPQPRHARRHRPLRPAVDLARERRRPVRRAAALVPSAEGLARARAASRPAVRALLVDERDRVLLLRWERTAARPFWITPGGGDRAGREPRAGAASRAARGGRARRSPYRATSSGRPSSSTPEYATTAIALAAAARRRLPRARAGGGRRRPGPASTRASRTTAGGRSRARALGRPLRPARPAAPRARGAQPRQRFVIGVRRSRPNAFGRSFTPGGAWRRLYSARSIIATRALDHVRVEAVVIELLARAVELDVRLEHAVELGVRRQRVLVELVVAQLGARRAVDDRLRDQLAAGALVQMPGRAGRRRS